MPGKDKRVRIKKHCFYNIEFKSFEPSFTLLFALEKTVSRCQSAIEVSKSLAVLMEGVGVIRTQGSLLFSKFEFSIKPDLRDLSFS